MHAEFIGCSPSLSGALRVNPWSVDNIADNIYAAIKMPISEQVRPESCVFICIASLLGTGGEFVDTRYSFRCLQRHSSDHLQVLHV